MAYLRDSSDRESKFLGIDGIKDKREAKRQVGGTNIHRGGCFFHT